MPKAWRGAALQCRSSIGWQQAAPGNNPACTFTWRPLLRRDRPARPIELPNHGSFPGAACCQIAELPPFKAAPLQALGRFCALRLCKPSLFIAHPSSACALLGYSSSSSSSNSGGRSDARPHPQPATLRVARARIARRSVAGGEFWSTGVLRPVGIAPRVRGVGGAFRGFIGIIAKGLFPGFDYVIRFLPPSLAEESRS